MVDPEVAPGYVFVANVVSTHGSAGFPLSGDAHGGGRVCSTFLLHADPEMLIFIRFYKGF